MIYGRSERDLWSRHYVEVMVRHTVGGGRVPVALVWNDCRVFRLRFEGLARHKHPKTGGNALCFEVSIGKQRRDLWLDGDNWFVEVADPERRHPGRVVAADPRWGDNPN